MSSGQSEPKKGDETQDSPVTKEALATLVNLRQTAIDELLLYIERTTSKRSDWLLAIAGGTFAALLSSGLIKPGSVKWETKELLIALSLSSICGVIVKVYQSATWRFVTLTKEDIDRIRETFRKEIGDDPQKQRMWSTLMPNYLRSEILKFLKGGLPPWKYRKIERHLAKTDEEKLATDQKALRKESIRWYVMQAQFWILLIGILFHVLLVICHYHYK